MAYELVYCLFSLYHRSHRLPFVSMAYSVLYSRFELSKVSPYVGMSSGLYRIHDRYPNQYSSESPTFLSGRWELARIGLS